MRVDLGRPSKTTRLGGCRLSSGDNYRIRMAKVRTNLHPVGGYTFSTAAHISGVSVFVPRQPGSKHPRDELPLTISRSLKMRAL
jgi:hypothetical protein